jgi:hypothetical protein
MCKAVYVLVVLLLGGCATVSKDYLEPAASPYINKTCPGGIVSDPDIRQALPNKFVNSSGYASASRIRYVPVGGDLQAALNTALPGDVITLEPGATYVGPFILPKLANSTDWVEIRPATFGTGFPLPGQRIKPIHASLMPKLVTSSGRVIEAALGASRYRLVGLEVKPTSGVRLTNLIDLGSGATRAIDYPRNIILDRMYIHADPLGTRRGVALNGINMAVIDSYISGFREGGTDSQAIAGWNGPGPFKIINNTLIAASENIIFGGADPSITNIVPSDIEICYNHFTKPLSWRNQTGWNVKNLFELKNARRVLLAGNIFENNWADAQVGFAIVLKSSNQDDTAPWSTLEDITLSYNLIQHSGSGIDILGREAFAPSQPARRILIQNNVLRDISAEVWGGDGRLFQLVSPGPITRLKFDHNTAPVAGNAFMTMGDEGLVSHTFFFSNNIIGRGDYGVKGSGASEGTDSLQTFTTNYSFRRNAVIGAPSEIYPTDNFFPATIEDVAFIDYGSFNWNLAASSPYNNVGTDNKDLGADTVTLNSLIKNVRRGRN